MGTTPPSSSTATAATWSRAAVGATAWWGAAATSCRRTARRFAAAAESGSSQPVPAHHKVSLMHNGSGHGELYVLGAGWFSVEVAGWAQESGWRVGGLVELMDSARVGRDQEGYPIVDAAALPPGTLAVAAGGRSVDRRDAWAVAEEHGFMPGTIVHPTAHISPSATIEPGAIVAPLAVVSAR